MEALINNQYRASSLLRCWLIKLPIINLLDLRTVACFYVYTCPCPNQVLTLLYLQRLLIIIRIITGIDVFGQVGILLSTSGANFRKRVFRTRRSNLNVGLPTVSLNFQSGKLSVFSFRTCVKSWIMKSDLGLHSCMGI